MNSQQISFRWPLLSLSLLILLLQFLPWAGSFSFSCSSIQITSSQSFSLTKTFKQPKTYPFGNLQPPINALSPAQTSTTRDSRALFAEPPAPSSTSASSSSIGFPVNNETTADATATTATQESTQQEIQNLLHSDAGSEQTLSVEEQSASKTSASVTSDETPIPSYAQLASFIGTTILIWLSEPLLSLVDTTVVAWTQREHAVVQLASLGPATTLCDSLLYSTYFLAISTTNQIAAALATKDTNKLLKTTSQVLGVAIVLGIICTMVVFGAGAPLLQRMAGKSASSELLYHATRYTYIRGAACIASCLNMVCQSFCLANLNTKTPFQAVVAASIINIIGDILLSPHLGVQGAAIATAASNVASMTILLRAVYKQWSSWKQQAKTEQNDTITSSTVSQDEIMPKETAPEATASSNRKDQARKFISLPTGKDIINLLKLAGPISFVIWAKVACYGAMTLRSTDFGVIPLATHSIMMRIFFFFSSMGDSVSQAAQSFVPSTLYPAPKPQKFQKVFQKLLVIAGIVGVVNSQVSVLILKYLGQYLTSDASIIQLMKEQSTNFGWALLLHPIIMILEGTVISSRDFVTLVASYSVTLCVHFGALSMADSFPAVWRTFLLFQGIRYANFSARVWKRQRDMRSSEKTADSSKANGAAVNTA